MWSTIWRNPSFTQRPRDTRLRALFIENLSGPVLQMLGTKYPYSILLSSSTYQRITFRYNIEPFFWSSSLNWIPSRFQEEIKENVGDRESDLKYSIFFFDMLVQILQLPWRSYTQCQTMMQSNLQLIGQASLFMTHPHSWVHRTSIPMHLSFYTRVCPSFLSLSLLF